MCAGVEGLISKIHLVALEEGKMINSYIGIPIVVKKKKKLNKDTGMLSDLLDEQMLGSEAIVHEVKRVGLLIDRYVDLEMRVGDHLVVYISRSQA